MMLAAGLQIYLRPPSTLTFDLLIPKVDGFTLLPCGLFITICIKIGSFVDKISCLQFRKRRTDGRTEGRTDNLRT